MARVEKGFAIICARCGSHDVSRDAWARWDLVRQEWTLRTVFDYAYCHPRDAEARLEERPLVPSLE